MNLQHHEYPTNHKLSYRCRSFMGDIKTSTFYIWQIFAYYYCHILLSNQTLTWHELYTKRNQEGQKEQFCSALT